MKRKRMIKVLMSRGLSRNEAVFCADACGPDVSHALIAFFLVLDPQAREMVKAMLPYRPRRRTITFTTGGIDEET